MFPLVFSGLRQFLSLSLFFCDFDGFEEYQLDILQNVPEI